MPENSCISRSSYTRFNPERQLVLQAACSDGCQSATASPVYGFAIYMNTETAASPVWSGLSNPNNFASLSGKIFCFDVNLSGYFQILMNRCLIRIKFGFSDHPETSL